MDLLGWILLGLLAGGISGWVVGVRSVSGCLPTIVVGVLGAVIGGWLMRQVGAGDPQGFLGALVVAIIGSIIVRIVLKAVEGSH